MGPITHPEVHNLSREKEQPTLKLNNKFYFRSLCKYSWSAINHSCHSWFCLYLYFERWCKPFQQEDANFIFGDQARKQSRFNFPHAYTTDLGTISIITPSYTSSNGNSKRSQRYRWIWLVRIDRTSHWNSCLIECLWSNPFNKMKTKATVFWPPWRTRYESVNYGFSNYWST